jgi:hypothetical protein
MADEDLEQNSPQENFIRESSKEGGLTRSDVNAASSYATAIGREFDPDKGYSTRPTQDSSRSHAPRGPRGPDSRDRDRTGRISNDELRAINRESAISVKDLQALEASGRINKGVAGTLRGSESKSPFDAGKIQAVLARLGRSIGGSKEVERQLDSAFGSGARPSPRSEPSLPTTTTNATTTEDFTDAIDGANQSFRDREKAAGLHNTTLGRDSGTQSFRDREKAAGLHNTTLGRDGDRLDGMTGFSLLNQQ